MPFDPNQHTPPKARRFFDANTLDTEINLDRYLYDFTYHLYNNGKHLMLDEMRFLCPMQTPVKLFIELPKLDGICTDLQMHSIRYGAHNCRTEKDSVSVHYMVGTEELVTATEENTLPQLLFMKLQEHRVTEGLLASQLHCFFPTFGTRAIAFDEDRYHFAVKVDYPPIHGSSWIMRVCKQDGKAFNPRWKRVDLVDTSLGSVTLEIEVERSHRARVYTWGLACEHANEIGFTNPYLLKTNLQRAFQTMFLYHGVEQWGKVQRRNLGLA